MKKAIAIILVIFYYSTIQAQQNEFNYFSLCIGMTHNIYSPQPTNDFTNKYLNSPDGQLQLNPASSYFGYVPGYHGGLFFHYDFESDKGGIVVGLDYSNNGISAKYNSTNSNYWLLETQRIQSIGIPAFFKFGSAIFDNQKYLFIGAQYNFNRQMKEISEVGWTSTQGFRKTSNDEFRSNNIMILLGFNIMFFKVEFDYYPKSFINIDYIDQATNYRPYSNQPDKLFFIKTSFNIPLSDWTTQKSYKISKFIRRLRIFR
jgi:hypothetical protein